MRKIVFIAMVAFSGLSSAVKAEEAQTLRWTSFEHLNDSLRKERKPILVFIHTDWCKYCKMMELKTFTDPKLVKSLNERFYCLELNAEENHDLPFLNRTYKFKASGVNTGVHELAEVLGTEKGKLTYPTTVVLNQNLQLEGRIVGAVEAARLQLLVQ